MKKTGKNIPAKISDFTAIKKPVWNGCEWEFRFLVSRESGSNAATMAMHRETYMYMYFKIRFYFHLVSAEHQALGPLVACLTRVADCSLRQENWVMKNAGQ
jgi:hypothetical protein